MHVCHVRVAAWAAAALAASSFAATPGPEAPRATAPAPMRSRAHEAPLRHAPAVRPCTTVRMDQPVALTLGKSQLVHLDFPAARVVVGGARSAGAGAAPPPSTGASPAALAATPAGGMEGAPGGAMASNGVADTEVTLLSPTELFFLGRRAGSMNVVLQSADGRCVVKDITVSADPATLQAKLNELMPQESGVKVHAAESGLVLTGNVTDAVQLDQVLRLAGSYADPRRIVNLLRVDSPQQVMLEVKIAEVSKTLLDRFGLDFSRLVTSANGLATSIISGVIGGGAGVLGRFAPNTGGGAINGSASVGTTHGVGSAGANVNTTGRGSTTLGVDAQKKDGILRVLAEPNIMAISGQQASFLSGGKIFIPVAQSSSSGAPVITLEEKEFGVGLKFTPTVLDGNRINLKLVSEASELQQTGSPFTSFNGATAILPSLATRRVDTTVQLGDGQSFVVAGLIKNNLSQALDKFPGLGDVPVMGALFRSTEFATDQTELMFVVTPHLVKPLAGGVTLPTDNHVPATANDAMLRGAGEGSAPAPASPYAPPAAPASAPRP